MELQLWSNQEPVLKNEKLSFSQTDFFRLHFILEIMVGCISDNRAIYFYYYLKQEF